MGLGRFDTGVRHDRQTGTTLGDGGHVHGNRLPPGHLIPIEISGAGRGRGGLPIYVATGSASKLSSCGTIDLSIETSGGGRGTGTWCCLRGNCLLPVGSSS